MNITPKKWNNVSEREKAKGVYLSAFPKEERLPWWLLRLFSCRRDMGITAYYDGHKFCGITVSAATEKVLFLLFFAVEDDCRGRGCGSEILQLLKKENPGRAIVLNVEPLDEAAENAAQRVSRMRFYNRNGFYDTGYDIDEVGGTFRVLSDRPLDAQAYLQVFRRLSFGFWKPYLREAEQKKNGG